MATIITVHGTFAAPTAADPNGGPMPELQWWETGSTFEKDMRQFVEARDGELNFVPFPWAGDNSEVERRDAGGYGDRSRREERRPASAERFERHGGHGAPREGYRDGRDRFAKRSS